LQFLRDLEQKPYLIHFQINALTCGQSGVGFGPKWPKVMPKDQRNFGRQVIALLGLTCYTRTAFQYIMESNMDTVSVNQFRDKLKSLVEHVVNNHTPLKVTRRAGEAFVVMSADDWEREQETLYVLQNNSLMKQIADSMATHNNSSGYTPTSEELNEITGI
jgi:antitoxin YefM